MQLSNVITNPLSQETKNRRGKLASGNLASILWHSELATYSSSLVNKGSYPKYCLDFAQSLALWGSVTLPGARNERYAFLLLFLAWISSSSTHFFNAVQSVGFGHQVPPWALQASSLMPAKNGALRVHGLLQSYYAWRWKE